MSRRKLTRTALAVVALAGVIGALYAVLGRSTATEADAIAIAHAPRAEAPLDDDDEPAATPSATTLRVLFGEVVDESDAPIAGATVQARLADGSIETRATDSEGAFTLDGFRSDVVTLSFSAQGFKRVDVSGDALPRMSEASWSQKLVRSNERLFGVGGTVVDDKGAPVTAFRLVIQPRAGEDHDRSNRTRVHHVSDARGEFEKTEVDVPVTLQIIAPSFRPASVDASPGDRVRVALVRSNALRGRITDAVTGAPVVGAAVSLDGLRMIGGTKTDEEGRYAIETLPVEKISVNVRAEGYLPLTLGGIEGGRSRDETLDAKLTPATAGVSTEVVGIGVSVGRHDDGVLVKGVFDNGPARGVLDDGDVIIEADGVALGGRPLREGMAAIRGEPGTSVRLTVRKADGAHVERVTLERARVAVPEG